MEGSLSYPLFQTWRLEIIKAAATLKHVLSTKRGVFTLIFKIWEQYP